VLEQSPRAMRRTFTLREMAALVDIPTEEHALLPRLAQARARQPPARDSIDIDDPMGREWSMFQAIGQQVASSLLPVLDTLRAVLK